MPCAFHPSNAATAQCVGCERPLCPSCDHRIKGMAHCEDCIVRGVDALRRLSTGVPQYAPVAALPAPSGAVRVRSHAKRATLFALVPGLGAVYNRQNFKAFVHFLGVAGLFQVSNATHLDAFAFAGIVFHIFTIFDANRTAKAIAAGADPREDEARLRWMFARHKGAWGATLVGAALLVAGSTIPGVTTAISASRVWAVLLFGAGAYLIATYVRSSRSAADPGATIPPPPRSAVSTSLPPADYRAGSRSDANF